MVQKGRVAQPNQAASPAFSEQARPRRHPLPGRSSRPQLQFATGRVRTNQMRTIIQKAGLQWLGWHGFRSGLASNLNRFGVDDSVTQAILRHDDVSVTQRCYIKTTMPDALSAMRRLSEKTLAIRDRDDSFSSSTNDPSNEQLIDRTSAA